MNRRQPETNRLLSCRMSVGMLGPILLILTFLLSCFKLDKVYVSPRFGYKVWVVGPNAEDSRIRAFIEHLDVYTEQLVSRLGANGEWLSRIEIYVFDNERPSEAGRYWPPRRIDIELQGGYTALAVYGHELVRAMYWYELGRLHAQTPSTLPREQTPIGQDWDIADEIAADMLETGAL